MKPILETKNLCVSYGNTKILEDINISVNNIFNIPLLCYLMITY